MRSSPSRRAGERTHRQSHHSDRGCAVFTDASGVIAGNTTWPANSRIHVTSTLTINAGVTLTIGAGTIVTLFSGTGVAAVRRGEVVNGTLQVNGTEASPVVFAPDAAGRFWGGIELPVPTSQVNATFAIFTGSGEDATWFDTHAGYSTHKPQQALFLVAGSGSGTGIGAQLHLNNCYCFSLAGQEMNSRGNTWVDLNRTLMQRAITCGELNATKSPSTACALLNSAKTPRSSTEQRALYLTNGDEFTPTRSSASADDGVDAAGTAEATRSPRRRRHAVSVIRELV